MKTLKLLIVPMLLVVVSGCATHAIEPLRMTYSYPVGEACSYQTETACGAVAFWNDKLIELYMPYLQKSFRHKPQRFEFDATDNKNILWRGKMANVKNSDQDINAHFILKDDDEADKREANDLYKPMRGMLVIVFPNNEQKYKELAGKTIWLVPTVGWDNVKLVRMIWASESKLPESTGILFSKE